MKLTVNKFFSEETLLTSIIYLRSIWKKYEVSLFLTFCLLTGCFGNESWVKTSRSKCLVKLNAWTVQVLIRSFSKLSGSAVPGSVTENFLLVIGWLCYVSFSCKKQEDNSSCMLLVVMCLVIDRAPGMQKGPTVKMNVRNRKVNLVFPKPCKHTKWSRLASFLRLTIKLLWNDLRELELFFELQMQGHDITGSVSVFALFSFLFSSIVQPSDIIRLHRIVVKSLVAMWNLKVFLVCWSFTVIGSGTEQQTSNLSFRKKLKNFFNWSHFIIMPYHVIFLALQKAQCLTFWNVSIAFLKDLFLNIWLSGR